MRLIRTYILLLFVFIIIPVSFSQELVNIETTSTSTLANNDQVSLIDSVLNFSKRYIGSPYRGGSAGPNSFDCSGFTSFVFQNFGIKLGRSSSDQAEQLPTVQNEDIRPGDLVFYNGRRRGHRVGHVGMVVETRGNGEFTFIHSASSVGISYSNSSSDYYKRRFVKAGRVFNNDSLLTKIFTRTKNSNADLSYVNKPENTENIETEYQNITIKKTIPAKYHTVKSGETLSGISAKYGVTVSQLRKMNKINGDHLALKQKIKVTDSKKVDVVEKVAVTKPKTTLITDSTIATNNTEKISTTSNVKHSIKKGETLFSISKQYGLTVNQLKELNNIKNGSIFPGQELIVSDSKSTAEINTKQTEATKETEIAKVSKPVSAKAKNKTHTVHKGETLSDIAERYNCSVKQIKNWNSKKNNRINAGEKLIIKV